MSATSTPSQTTTFSAPDIECDGCANAIRRALSALPGVADVRVDIDRKLVSVAHDPQAAGDAELLAGLEDAGFPATVVPSEGK